MWLVLGDTEGPTGPFLFVKRRIDIATDRPATETSQIVFLQLSLVPYLHFWKPYGYVSWADGADYSRSR